MKFFARLLSLELARLLTKGGMGQGRGVKRSIQPIDEHFLGRPYSCGSPRRSSRRLSVPGLLPLHPALEIWKVNGMHAAAGRENWPV